MSELRRLESPDLIVKILDNGTFSVAMKSAGLEWLPDPWEQIACRVVWEDGEGRQRVADFKGARDVSLAQEDRGLGFTFANEGGNISVRTWVSLDGSCLRAGAREVTLPEGARLHAVHYPFRCFHLVTGRDHGYLALPSGEGCLIPTGPVRLGTTAFWAWHDSARSRFSHFVEHGPTMPFYGAQRDGAGFTAILETSDDFVLEYLLNSNAQYLFDAEGRQSPYVQIACAWPVWLAQHGKLGYERRMRFEFQVGLDYVGMAKAYRREARRVGHLVTLREKAEARPQIDRLAGAPYLAYYAGYPHLPPGQPGFAYRYDDLSAVIEDLSKGMGLRRAFVHFWGAYSVQPPGCLPFDATPGPIEELAAVVERCKEAGFLFTLYNDVSAQLEETEQWFPDLMWRRPDGKVEGGGRWTRTCSSQYTSLLAEHMPEVVRTLGLEAAYVDCVNHGRMRECYNPEHSLTRGQDREARLDFYRYVHSLGLIMGGEHAGWWNAAELEYTNGVGHVAATLSLLRTFPVPLYHLVFHDTLAPFCHAGDDYTVSHGTAFEDKVLRDLLRGVPPMYFLNLRDHGTWRRKILQSCQVMSDPTAAVLYDEMMSHEHLTDDQMVQRTRFSSGVEVTVNFDEVAREGLPAKGYLVVGLPGGTRTGGFETHILSVRKEHDR